ncbi:MarR family protein [Nocardioides terrae]|uniref:MarR family protein n=1 Tax=Nocardioides terrae TaxID=574651 RepID=A0A1I1KJU8_9ACTN|nr:MarR family transcriptional regulator [Nocardioides terrae]SFC61136.1 MarR family protein [Nocardioides terrae]
MTTTVSPTRADALRQLEDEVTVLFHRIKRVLVERAHAVHPELSGLGLPMLMRIAAGPVRASALVEEFQVDKGAVSRHLQHLEELGLIERTPDPDDGRATLLSVTPDAARRLGDIDADRRTRLKDRLADWSASDLAALAEQLGRYNHSLDRQAESAEVRA